MTGRIVLLSSLWLQTLRESCSPLVQCCEEAAVQVQMLLWQEYGKCKIELGSTFVHCDEIGCDISLERGLCTNFWTNCDENDQKTLQTAAVFDLDIFHRLLNEQKGGREVRNCHQLLIVLLAHLFFFSPSWSADQLWLWLDVPACYFMCVSLPRCFNTCYHLSIPATLVAITTDSCLGPNGWIINII